MEFFEAVKARRSIRKYTTKPVPEAVMQNAFDAAILAPNSSNMQTTEFYWVQSPEQKNKLIEACLSQGAAKTAQELVVVIANRSLWKRNNAKLIEHLSQKKSPDVVLNYYKKLMPFIYGWSLLAPLKYLLFNIIGIFKPMMRRPWSSRDLDEVAIKSAALACENFMLAISAQGFDTCPMEGLDEARVKKLLGLNRCERCYARVVMVISVGERDAAGVWGEQYRNPKDWFVKKI